MDLGIAGKRALVIGGTSGLGLASAEALAAEGVNLALSARNADTLAEVTERLAGEHGITAEGYAGDVTKQDDVKRIRAEVEASGGIDILILNTPRPPSPMRDFFDETEDERWQVAYHNQLESALFVLRHLAPLLRGKGWGRLVAITSASVKQPMPRHAVSSIFRAGVHAALKHLVDELGPDGVTVNAVAPATVITPTFANYHNLDARVAAIPLKRPGKGEELGATVAFLSSEHAGFITGETIQFDGGMTRALL